jgi:hypothetical protein
MKQKQIRRVYIAFEFEKDAERHTCFMSDAEKHCLFVLEDLSLPAAVHNSSWQREALKRIHNSQIVFVLLGLDTHNAPGVHDEISLAGKSNKPIVQIVPQGQNYGEVSQQGLLTTYKWSRINEILSRLPDVR